MHSLTIIVYMAAAFVVTKLPYVRTYLLNFYSLLHEVSRVLLSGGKSNQIKLLKKGDAWRLLTRKHSNIRLFHMCVIQ